MIHAYMILFSTRPLRAVCGDPRWRRLFPILVCMPLFGAALGGCALGDYEARIDAQRKRLEVVDEENRYLSPEAIDNPQFDVKDKATTKKASYWPFDVFLRPPRDIAPMTAKKDGYMFNFQEPRLFRYAGAKGYNMFVAAGLIEKEKPKDG